MPFLHDARATVHATGQVVTLGPWGLQVVARHLPADHPLTGELVTLLARQTETGDGLAYAIVAQVNLATDLLGGRHYQRAQLRLDLAAALAARLIDGLDPEHPSMLGDLPYRPELATAAADARTRA